MHTHHGLTSACVGRRPEVQFSGIRSSSLIGLNTERACLARVIVENIRRVQMTDPKVRNTPTIQSDTQPIGKDSARQEFHLSTYDSESRKRKKKQDTKHYTSTYQKYYIYTTASNTRVADEEHITNNLQVAFSSFYHYTSTRTEINNEIG